MQQEDQERGWKMRSQLASLACPMASDKPRRHLWQHQLPMPSSVHPPASIHAEALECWVLCMEDVERVFGRSGCG